MVYTHEEVMGLTIAPAEITGHTLDGPVERISGLGRPGVTAFAAEGGFVSDAGLAKGPCLDHIRENPAHLLIEQPRASHATRASWRVSGSRAISPGILAGSVRGSASSCPAVWPIGRRAARSGWWRSPR